MTAIQFDKCGAVSPYPNTLRPVFHEGLQKSITPCIVIGEAMEDLLRGAPWTHLLNENEPLINH